MWGLLKKLYVRRRGGLAGAFFLALLTLAAGVGLLGVSGWFLTGAALAGAGAIFNLFVPSSLVRGLSFIRIASRYAERLAGHAATLRLLSDLRGSVFRSLLRLTPRQLSRYRAGDLVARLTGDVDALDAVFLFVIMPVATALVGGAIFCLVLGYHLPGAGLAVAGALLVASVLVPWWLGRVARRSGEQAQASAAALRHAVIETVEGHVDIAALHVQSQACEHFAVFCGQLQQARGGQARLAAYGLWLVQAAAGAAVVAVLWFGLPALAAGQVSGPLLAGLLLATLGIFEVAGPIMRGVSRLGAARAAARRIGELTRAEPDLRDPAEPQALPEHGELRAQGLRFAYPGREQAVLDGVDLMLAPGERIGIVGPSGSGKSTLLHLLLRLEDPQAGAVTLGGCDLRHAAQADIHRRIALLSQDSPVFLGSLRSNLLIGAPEADEAALWQALASARLADFTRGLPQGLDTWVGEGGAGLSAGQARRLCLARVLLSAADIILLDEPTAGLDRPNEEAFLGDLAHACASRAVVLATHARLPEGAVHRVLALQDGHLI
ncbi:thiol reductant ABC exporter, CydC subunit [Bordetella holmesii 30539]|uniref:Thiol reductant ABC exporter, CydC subunit n=3 Tax=Bordetella holmesii TaxID=35814 RepID=A0A158M7H9_9BORD|nr:thiol reductant ABC exporter, CydC subunit [Bordetella holmesii 44057]EWM47081.1 thiol reductant ABC exporter, CydC subunit [Bordetella holmesii 35009]EXF90100.1 thiol reductant ABC exporter, CydC subunit [Bordetella holmesii 30539]EXX96307.1 thiol reductant ABC exporter, CydC subunit [Bordetella holmesii 1058]KAK80759.1 thiol reductant ABC exporter, CydC subunit [Bordetella holmesii CDC-H572-BH]KAK84570.1 thiol reductant ABC exporter, CydC subunit [Bordetella holmesii CDC-H809-BH]KAK87956